MFFSLEAVLNQVIRELVFIIKIKSLSQDSWTSIGKLCFKLLEIQSLAIGFFHGKAFLEPTNLQSKF